VTNILNLRQPGHSEDHGLERNPGMDYRPELFNSLRINRSAVERRASTIAKRRSVKKDHQTAWLLKVITCMDLTTLAGDDTPGKVKRLCQKARQPVRKDILAGLGVADMHIHTGAVCVYHNLIETAVKELEGSGIPVAAVSTGFPAGQIPLSLKLAQVRASVAAGAAENLKARVFRLQRFPPVFPPARFRCRSNWHRCGPQWQQAQQKLIL